MPNLENGYNNLPLDPERSESEPAKRVFNYSEHVKAQGRPLELGQTFDITKQQLQAGEHLSALLIIGSSDFALLVRTERDFVYLEDVKKDRRFVGLFAISDELASKAQER